MRALFKVYFASIWLSAKSKEVSWETNMGYNAKMPVYIKTLFLVTNISRAVKMLL